MNQIPNYRRLLACTHLRRFKAVFYHLGGGAGGNPFRYPEEACGITDMAVPPLEQLQLIVPAALDNWRSMF